MLSVLGFERASDWKRCFRADSNPFLLIVPLLTRHLLGRQLRLTARKRRYFPAPGASQMSRIAGLHTIVSDVAARKKSNAHCSTILSLYAQKQHFAHNQIQNKGLLRV
ncbi:hypothetical protein ABVK25_001312 [Lepraria finkii]|uniref:Uncharacterized protein n=1 Tax=Lepraria finkii TaxID=1340010 RepID=A0ABR4BLA5_9LECA